MKRILTNLALAASFCLAPAEAFSAEVQFIGRLIITSASGTCPNDPIGQRVFARWRPAGVGTNPANSTLAIFRTTQAVHYNLDAASFDATLRAVETTVITGDAGPLDYTAKVAFSNIDPQTIGATTEFINVTGRIRGFDFMPGCVANFRLAAVKRVN